MRTKGRLSACALMASSWGLDECLLAWSKSGLDGIGLTRPLACSAPPGVLRARLESHGLRVSTLQNLDPFDVVEPRRSKVGSRETLKYLDLGAELGALCVMACVGPRGEKTVEEALQILETQLGALIPCLKERGLRLAIEPLHPLRQDLSFLNLAVDVVELLERIDSEHVGYAFDLWHLWWQRGIEETAARSASRIFCVQPSDHKAVTLRTWDRAIPGDGIIPIARLVKAIEGGGYGGFYELEILSDDNEAQGYETTLQMSMTAFSEVCESIR